MEYIFLSGEIGWEITANSLQKEFKELKGKEVEIYFNSVGGYVSDGFAIYDYIKLMQTKGYTIHTVGTGIVASATTFPFLAGKKSTRKVHSTTTFLCHKAWSGAMGTDDDFEKQARELKATNDKIAGIYEAETDLTKEEALELMAKDESSNTDYLLEKGFISEIIKYEAVASIRHRMNNNNNNNNNMTKEDKNWINSQFEKIKNLFAPKNKVVQDAKGTDIDFYELEDTDTVKVDDKAKIDGKEADGSYLMPDNKGTYIFAAGVLTEIKEVENEDGNDDMEALKKENAELKEQLEVSNKTVVELNSSINDKEEKLKEIEKEFNSVKSKITNSFEWNGKTKDGDEPKKRQILKKVKNN